MANRHRFDLDLLFVRKKCSMEYFSDYIGIKDQKLQIIDSILNSQNINKKIIEIIKELKIKLIQNGFLTKNQYNTLLKAQSLCS